MTLGAASALHAAGAGQVMSAKERARFLKAL